MQDEACCRGCGRTLAGPLPVEGSARIACTCGFINLFEHNVTILPLRTELALAGHSAVIDTLLADTDDSLRCQQVLEQSFRLLVTAAREAVLADLEAAKAARWHTLVEFDGRSRAFRAGDRQAGLMMTVVSRAVQLLEACLFEAGIETGEGALLDPEEVQPFVDRFFRLASNAGILAPMVDNFRNGLGTGRIRGGQFEIHKTPAHTRYQEWIINRARLEKSGVRRVDDDELFSKAAADAVETWLGFSPSIGRTLFQNKHEQLVERATRREVTVCAIPRSTCAGDLGRLFDRLTLTAERARRFELPFYWDLGAEAGPGEADCAFRLASRNWLFYYPVLAATIDGEPGYFVSAEALTHSIAGMEGMKNGILQRVTTVMASEPSGDELQRTRVNQLRVKANRRFEDLAAVAGREMGFAVGHGIDRLHGTFLDGGELDLLWVRADAGGLLLLLGEVKDFDVVLHRIGSESSLRQRLVKAAGQLDRKVATLRRKWRELAEFVTGKRVSSPSAILAKAIVTSSYLPPHLADRYPVLTLSELDSFMSGATTSAGDPAPRYKDMYERLL
jgi:hypothetical protein